jgi:hypothetical protein
MVQDIIFKASWKVFWEAPDHPPPVSAAKCRLLLLIALLLSMSAGSGGI